MNKDFIENQEDILAMSDDIEILNEEAALNILALNEKETNIDRESYEAFRIQHVPLPPIIITDDEDQKPTKKNNQV